MSEKNNRQDQLQADIDARLAAQRKTINVKQEKRSNIEKITTIMTWMMIIVLVGALIFSAMSSVGLIG
jgi:F0F1-type ATP synthase assembly protein I